MGAAAAQASAHASTSKKLRERLQQTEADCDFLMAALTAEQEARAEAEQRLVSGHRVHGDNVAVLGLFAQQKTEAKEVRSAPTVRPELHGILVARVKHPRLPCLTSGSSHVTLCDGPWYTHRSTDKA